jgi:multidrug efflux system membrane fusion protein
MDTKISEDYIAPDRQLPPAPDSHPHRKHRWIVWLAVLAAFALLAWIVIRHKPAQSAATQGGGRHGGSFAGPVPVTIATAKTGSLGIYLGAIGTVTPVYTVSISAQVSGVITGVHYNEGQFVNKGNSLIDIDPRPYQAQLEQAEGALERDKNLLAEAQMDLDRYKLAWSKNAIPRQTLEDQEKVVQQYQGTVKNDEGTVRLQTVQLGYCHIVSPITGRVGLRLVDPGNLVTANGTTALVVITQSRPMTVIFTLSEDNLADVVGQVRKGRKLTVEAWDRQMKNKISTGHLATIDNQIDTTTGTLRLRALFDNSKDELFPNQFVNTRLLVNTLQNQTLVPSSAIQHNGDAAFVYVIQNNQAKMTPVQTGASDEGNTAVTGIKAGDVVADSSFDKLTNGAKITVSKTPISSGSSESGTL